MSGLKDKAKETMDVATAAAKQTSENIVKTSKDVAQKTVKAIKKGGKRLQGA